MPGCGDFRPPGDHNSPHVGLEQTVDKLASCQHRVIAHRQLTRLGLSANAISKRVAVGRLHRIHRGVFVVGPLPLTRHGAWMAAVLACGDETVLSHRSNGALLGLRPDNRRTVDVTTPRHGRHRAGIALHRSRHLTDADITTVDGIPCTGLARTLLDLAEVIDRRGLERAIDRAEQLRLLDMRALDDVLDRATGRRGAKLLRQVLAQHHPGSTLTASELEERFLLICLSAAVPVPEVNGWIGLPEGDGYRADFLWRHHRLIIEVDGHTTHGTRRAFEHDRARDQRLALAGYQVIRFTWHQITREPERVAATLRGLLAASDLVA